MVEEFKDIDVLDCPICQGPAIIEDEQGWCVYVSCGDCGCHTAEVPYENKKEKAQAAKKAATLWNMGKVLSSEPGE